MYHEREDAPALQQVIEDSVQTDPHRQEVKNMKKSYAEVLKDEGRKEERLTSRREMLLEAIRTRIGEPPAAVVAAVEASADIAQLDAWFRRALTAQNLTDLGIQPAS